MDVSTLCTLLAVVSRCVTIGCLECCVCAMDWIVDSESVNMTMLYGYGQLIEHQLMGLYLCVRVCVRVSVRGHDPTLNFTCLNRQWLLIIYHTRMAVVKRRLL